MKSRFYRHVMQLGWLLVRFSQRRSGPSTSTEHIYTTKGPIRTEYIGGSFIPTTYMAALQSHVTAESGGSTPKSSRGA